MRSPIWNIDFAWILAPFVLGACVQIVGIDDPKPIEEKPSETSGSGSSGSSSGNSSSSSSGGGGGVAGPWIGWRMPNPADAMLPNPSKYTVDASKGIVYDNVTGLSWQQNVDVQAYNWDQAKAYCENLTYGGYSDWRLPWRIELVSLIDYTRVGPAIDPAFPNTPIDNFWSASIYSDVNSYGWAVNFNYGDTQTVTRTLSTRVRCVR